MGVWEVVAGLLPDSLVHIEQDNTNITIVDTGDGHSLKGVSEDEDGVKVLEVDFESLSEQERTRLVDAAWTETGELFVDESREDKEAIERASKDDRIQNTLDFFRPRLEDRHFGMLRAALYLRDAWEGERQHLERGEMRERKRDIAERFGDEAWAVCNLSTAGYFDEGGYVRQLFNDLQSAENTDEREYQKLFEEVVNNQPFTVFVGVSDTIPAIKGDVKQRMRQKQQYRVDFDFIDVRGIGDRNRDKITRAVGQLEKEADEFEHETISTNPDMVERIYINDLEGLVE